MSSAESVTVVVVDNSSVVRTLVERALSARPDTRVESFATGSEALSYVTKGHRLDVLIVEIEAQELDAVALTRLLRVKRAHAHTPIIVIATEAQEERKAEARAAGATAWLIKPMQPEQLVALVDRVLENRES